MTSLLQRVIAVVEKDLIELKVSLWWSPVERQAAGGVSSDGQVSDSCWG